MDFFTVDRVISRKRLLGITFLTWIGVLGFDLFLHGGILAGFYLEESPFLLPPLEAFRRIPFGYLGFFINIGFLVWLLARLGLVGWRNGLVFGGVIGGVIWISLALGLYSISTASPRLIVGWALGQTIEMAYAGAVIGLGLHSQRPRRLTLAVVFLTLILVLLTFVLQSIGLVPTVSAG
jgi:hypothetical protein